MSQNASHGTLTTPCREDTISGNAAPRAHVRKSREKSASRSSAPMCRPTSASSASAHRRADSKRSRRCSTRCPRIPSLPWSSSSIWPPSTPARWPRCLPGTRNCRSARRSRVSGSRRITCTSCRRTCRWSSSMAIFTWDRAPKIARSTRRSIFSSARSPARSRITRLASCCRGRHRMVPPACAKSSPWAVSPSRRIRRRRNTTACRALRSPHRWSISCFRRGTSRPSSCRSRSIPTRRHRRRARATSSPRSPKNSSNGCSRCSCRRAASTSCTTRRPRSSGAFSDA